MSVFKPVILVPLSLKAFFGTAAFPLGSIPSDQVRFVDPTGDDTYADMLRGDGHDDETIGLDEGMSPQAEPEYEAEARPRTQATAQIIPFRKRKDLQNKP